MQVKNELHQTSRLPLPSVSSQRPWGRGTCQHTTSLPRDPMAVVLTMWFIWWVTLAVGITPCLPREPRPSVQHGWYPGQKAAEWGPHQLRASKHQTSLPPPLQDPCPDTQLQAALPSNSVSHTADPVWHRGGKNGLVSWGRRREPGKCFCRCLVAGRHPQLPGLQPAHPLLLVAGQSNYRYRQGPPQDLFQDPPCPNNTRAIQKGPGLVVAITPQSP